MEVLLNQNSLSAFIESITESKSVILTPYKRNINHKSFELSTFLIIGGSNAIGQVFLLNLLALNPALVVVVDSDEQAMIRLTHQIRHSSSAKLKCRFRYHIMDTDSESFDRVLSDNEAFDFIINLNGYTDFHSDRDFHSLQYLFEVNYFKVKRLLEKIALHSPKSYLQLSSLEAVDPTNFIGVSQLLTEHLILNFSSSFTSKILRAPFIPFINYANYAGLIDAIEFQSLWEINFETLKPFVSYNQFSDLIYILLFNEDSNGLYVVNEKFVNHISTTTLLEQFFTFFKLKPIPVKKSLSHSQIIELYQKDIVPIYNVVNEVQGLKKIYRLLSEHENNMLNTNQIFNIVNPIKIDLVLIESELKAAFENRFTLKLDLIQLFEFHIPNFKYQENGSNLSYL